MRRAFVIAAGWLASALGPGLWLIDAEYSVGGFALAYVEWIGPGLGLGVVAAVAIILMQPTRRHAA